MNKHLKSLAKALKVPLDKNVQQDCVSTYKFNKIQSNFIHYFFQRVTNQVFKLLEASKSNLAAKNPLEKAEIQQYIEYCVVYACHIDNPQNMSSVLGVSHFLKILTLIHSNVIF